MAIPVPGKFEIRVESQQLVDKIERTSAGKAYFRLIQTPEVRNYYEKVLSEVQQEAKQQLNPTHWEKIRKKLENRALLQGSLWISFALRVYYDAMSVWLATDRGLDEILQEYGCENFVKMIIDMQMEALREAVEEELQAQQEDNTMSVEEIRALVKRKKEQEAENSSGSQATKRKRKTKSMEMETDENSTVLN